MAATVAPRRKRVSRDNPYLVLPPTQDDLPHTDGEPMESECHALQLPLLKDPLLRFCSDRTDFYVGTNMFVYFSPKQEKTQDFKGPDVFVVQGVTPRTRKSYLVWEEGKGPDVVIEFISPSTAASDKVHKKEVYQDKLRVPEYFWCDPYSNDFAGFSLQDGKYKRLKPDSRGMIHSVQLGLALTRWQGVYSGVNSNWLRWATPKGILLPTSQELERTEAKRADQEKKRADALAELLKKHGIDPNSAIKS